MARIITLLVLLGSVSLGTVLMTVSLIRRSRAQLASAASGSGALVTTLTTADRLLWLQDHHAASVAAAGTEPAPARLRSGITVRGLSFSYPGTEREVLTDITLFLPAGATVAVVGENGSGETTLVKLLPVSHRFSTVRMADLIVYLEGGHAVEAGTHEP